MDAIKLIKGSVDVAIQDLLKPMFGKPCCRKQVGSMKSLSIGFGNKIQHGNPKLKDDYYGEWELGTYNSAWRVMDKRRILCGIHDPVDSIEELNGALNRIELGSITSLEHYRNLDVRVELDNNIIIDFLAATSDDDELFHIFCPGDKYVEFTVERGWTLGESEKPWKK